MLCAWAGLSEAVLRSIRSPRGFEGGQFVTPTACEQLDALKLRADDVRELPFLKPSQVPASCGTKMRLGFWLGVHALPEATWPSYLNFQLLPMSADPGIGARP